MDHAINHRRALIGKRRRLSESAKAALYIIALLVAWGFVGEMEYSDAIAAQQSTCRGE